MDQGWLSPQNLTYREPTVKLNMDFDCSGSAPLNPTLFKGQLYICVTMGFSFLKKNEFKNLAPTTLQQQRGASSRFTDVPSSEILSQLFSKPIDLKHSAGQVPPPWEVTGTQWEGAALSCSWG